jgi:pimeloyl-ACP methyl ester carboxylesterase
MIDTWMADLPNGTRLSCRSAGTPGRPLMLFLHGFPEGAFVWDRLMAHFAAPEHGGFRCVAPNLRGFERSSAPAAVEAYKPGPLIEDVMQLAARESQSGRIHTLVAHDWGGAFAWGAAHAHHDRIERLVIINSPHPATFARDLRSNPEQQKASAYMHFLCRADAEERLAANDYELMWRFMQGSDAALSWLTEQVKDQYREVWDCGLTGGCNLYRVTPLKPPLPGTTTAADIPVLAPERVRVSVRTLVLWGMDDAALRPGLLDGLEAYVPDLTVQRIPHATHWVVHEQPDLIASHIERFNAN